MTKPFITTKQLGITAMLIALASVASLIKPYELPFGGSMTFFSMLFISLIGSLYGPAIGIVAGIAYGLLQIVLGAHIYYPMQAVLDYPLAFGALGLSGFFYRKKFGLVIGYLAGVFARYLIHVLSGILFFAEYAPEGTPAILYSVTYNATYLVPEAVLTLAILSVPAVNKAIKTIQNLY